jgi:hypothetical protein
MGFRHSNTNKSFAEEDKLRRTSLRKLFNGKLSSCAQLQCNQDDRIKKAGKVVYEPRIGLNYCLKINKY